MSVKSSYDTICFGLCDGEHAGNNGYDIGSERGELIRELKFNELHIVLN
jgi:hypothetical protein